MLTEKPVEGHRWKTVVCSTDEARAYFEQKGLTYNDIKEGDIGVLYQMLNNEIWKAIMAGETSVESISLSAKVDIVKNPNGSIKKCFLYVNSHYFTRREAISFNADGYIGFAGWADQGNTNPILRAFLKWCDYIAEERRDFN